MRTRAVKPAILRPCQLGNNDTFSYSSYQDWLGNTRYGSARIHKTRCMNDDL
nr:hypothetical protein [Candidatus Sigynarchaeota archaeon]